MCCVFLLEVMYCARREVLRQSRAASIQSMKQKGNFFIYSHAKISAKDVNVFSPPERRFTLFHDLLTGRTENSTPSKGFMESSMASSALPPVRRMQMLLSSKLIQLKHLRKISSLLFLRSISCPFRASTSAEAQLSRVAWASNSRFFQRYSSKSWKSTSNSPLATSFQKCLSFQTQQECPNLTSLPGIDSKRRSASGSLGRTSASQQQRFPLMRLP